MRPWLVVILALSSAPAFAAAPAGDAQAAKRFPQPVRVGDLLGRKLLEPTESQPLLGRVEGVTRHADGSLALLVHTGGLVSLGGRDVEVPVGSVALLGEHVALLDLTPAELTALPDAPRGASAVAAGDMISVGLVRPFH